MKVRGGPPAGPWAKDLFPSIIQRDVPFSDPQAGSTEDTTDFEATLGNRSFSIRVRGAGMTDLLVGRGTKVIAVHNDGRPGPTKITIPKDLLAGDLTVRVDGNRVPFDVSETGSTRTVGFDRPAGAIILTVEALRGAPPWWTSPVPMAGVGTSVAVAAVVVALIVRRLRRRRSP